MRYVTLDSQMVSTLSFIRMRLWHPPRMWCKLLRYLKICPSVQHSKRPHLVLVVAMCGLR